MVYDMALRLPEEIFHTAPFDGQPPKLIATFPSRHHGTAATDTELPQFIMVSVYTLIYERGQPCFSTDRYVATTTPSTIRRPIPDPEPLEQDDQNPDFMGVH